MRLSELGELGLLRELAARGLVKQIADDAALLEGGVVVTHDTLVEGVHFRLDWTSWRDLGYKAAAVNLSDLAASAARPEALIVGLGVPGETPLERVLELYEGIAETGVPVRGGDTAAASSVTLAVTAVGRSVRVPGRGGARPGDLVVVTGPLGGSGAGFRALAAGRTGDPVVARHLRPPLRLAEGLALGEVATAMLDVSDGLGPDARHLAEASGCRLVIDLGAVPREGELEDLGFGEDYELLATTPDPLGFAIVGHVEEGAGVVLRLDGRPVELAGWEHFRRGLRRAPPVRNAPAGCWDSSSDGSSGRSACS
jgi:thiamine-monophosphate kinase